MKPGEGVRMSPWLLIFSAAWRCRGSAERPSQRLCAGREKCFLPAKQERAS